MLFPCSILSPLACSPVTNVCVLSLIILQHPANNQIPAEGQQHPTSAQERCQEALLHEPGRPAPLHALQVRGAMPAGHLQLHQERQLV
jgi:hypothetical protein